MSFLTSWWILGLASGLFMSIDRLLGQFTVKLSPPTFVWLKSLICTLAFLPLAYLATWPQEWRFYAFSLACIILNWHNLNQIYKALRLYGAGMVTRVLPLGFLFTFLGWFLVDPLLLSHYLAHPVKSLIIMGLVIACTFFASRMSKCTLSREAFLYLLPVCAMGGLVGIFTKLGLQSTQSEGRVIIFTFLGALGVLSLQSLKFLVSKEPLYTEIVALKSKIGLGVVGILTISIVGYSLTKGYGTLLVDNPAYIAILDKMAAVWIILFYKATGHKDTSNSSSGILLFICVCLLIFMTGTM